MSNNLQCDCDKDCPPDVCITCGKMVKSGLWDNNCEPGHITVHQVPCQYCGKYCGMTIDDDFCGPVHLLCPNCLDTKRK